MQVVLQSFVFPWCIKREKQSYSALKSYCRTKWRELLFCYASSWRFL